MNNLGNLKVMTWNVQYLAGKRYVFWYDLPGGDGPDTRPSSEDLATTLDVIERSSGQSWIGLDRMRRAVAGDLCPR